MALLKKLLVMVALCCSITFNNMCASVESNNDAAYSLEHVLEGLRFFYDSLSLREQEDITVMFDELLVIGGQIQDFCDTYVKHNNLMLKYKQHQNIELFNLNAAFGCTARTQDPVICRDIQVLESFDHDSLLQTHELHEFYNQLDHNEQQELKLVIIEMFSFCKNIIYNLETLINKYPTIKAKLEQFMEQADQEFLISVGFDSPFPSIIYKIA